MWRRTDRRAWKEALDEEPGAVFEFEAARGPLFSAGSGTTPEFKGLTRWRDGRLSGCYTRRSDPTRPPSPRGLLPERPEAGSIDGLHVLSYAERRFEHSVNLVSEHGRRGSHYSPAKK
jgi:hypothetical protein